MLTFVFHSFVVIGEARQPSKSVNVELGRSASLRLAPGYLET